MNLTEALNLLRHYQLWRLGEEITELNPKQITEAINVILQNNNMAQTLEEVKKPIGDFIIENAVSTQGLDGAYYHYSEVCKLLRLQAQKMYNEEEVELAILFHNTYERLAPSFGYETRLDTKSFEANTPNGMLMIAVCKEIIKSQQERMYSEEDILEAMEWARTFSSKMNDVDFIKLFKKQ